MSRKEKILELLKENSGEYISEQFLSEFFGVSVEAIGEKIEGLRKEGYKIGVRTGVGYRLFNGTDPLIASEIRSYLSEPISSTEIMVYSSIDSTNEEAKRKLAEEKLCNWSIIVSEKQTAGKGRRGKNFDSPANSGLYMTIIYQIGREKGFAKNQVTDYSLMTIKAAVATCRGIEKLTDKQLKIKWVNDLFLEGKKVCGILSEATTSMETGKINSIVVGIGINVSTTQEDFSPDVRDVAGSLEIHSIDRNQLCAEIVNQLYAIIKKANNREVLEEYKEHSMILGKKIFFDWNNKRRFGEAIDINEEGNLMVNSNGEILTLVSGEVSIRGDWSGTKLK